MQVSRNVERRSPSREFRVSRICGVVILSRIKRDYLLYPPFLAKPSYLYFNIFFTPLYIVRFENLVFNLFFFPEKLSVQGFCIFLQFVFHSPLLLIPSSYIFAYCILYRIILSSGQFINPDAIRYIYRRHSIPSSLRLDFEFNRRVIDPSIIPALDSPPLPSSSVLDALVPLMPLMRAVTEVVRAPSYSDYRRKRGCSRWRRRSPFTFSPSR